MKISKYFKIQSTWLKYIAFAFIYFFLSFFVMPVPNPMKTSLSTNSIAIYRVYSQDNNNNFLDLAVECRNSTDSLCKALTRALYRFQFSPNDTNKYLLKQKISDWAKLHPNSYRKVTLQKIELNLPDYISNKSILSQEEVF